MKLASIIYGKSLDSLEFSHQGYLSVLQALPKGQSKWKDTYAMLKDNFLFFSKGPKSPPIDAIYFSSIKVNECDPLKIKRENCFSIHTQVFSAADKDSLSVWMKAFSNTQRWFEVEYDDITTATLMAYSKSNKTKSSTNVKALSPFFGFTIDDIAKREKRNVPTFIEYLTNFILTHGLEEEGLFRIPGSLVEMNELQEMFDTSTSMPDLSKYDIHTVCGVLKSFFRSMPNSIFTIEIESKLIPILCSLRTNHFQLHQGLSQISSVLKMMLSTPS